MISKLSIDKVSAYDNTAKLTFGDEMPKINAQKPVIDESTKTITGLKETKKSEAIDDIKDAVNKINEQLKNLKTRCEYTYHEEVNRVSIKIIEDGTEKVIKEIPPESTIEMVKELWRQAGILIDERR